MQTVAGLAASDAADAIASHGGTEVDAIAPIHLHVVTVPQADAAAATAAYQSDTRVVSVSADKLRNVGSAATDPSYGDQWALPRIGWEAVHGVVDPAGTATLAVLDTGVDATAPDLAGRVGSGWSFDATDPRTDPNGHGTHEATIAAGAADNGSGIAGVAYVGVSVMPVRVLGDGGTGQDSDIIDGLVYAVDHGADVVLMAFSNPGQSAALQAAVDYAWSMGVVVIAAAGNDGGAAPTYPAGLSKVVGVGATDQSDAVASFSNQSDAVFLAAPGVDIDASDASGVSASSGTSASAAIVAGAAALLRANDPSASNPVIVGRLARTADPVTGGAGGNGRVNLARRDRRLLDRRRHTDGRARRRPRRRPVRLGVHEHHDRDAGYSDAVTGTAGQLGDVRDQPHRDEQLLVEHDRGRALDLRQSRHRDHRLLQRHLHPDHRLGRAQQRRDAHALDDERDDGR